MTRWSAISGIRRIRASSRSRRARFALIGVPHTLLSLASAAIIALQAAAQTVELPPVPSTAPPAANGSSTSAPATPKLPPPNPPAARAAVQKEAVPPSDDLVAALDRPGDLDFHSLPLNNALFLISEQWGVNIVAGELQGTVNGVFRQAPLREILDSILLSNGYNYRAVGKSLVISSTEKFGQSNPSLQSATIPVLNADIDEVVEGAKLLVTPQGRVQALKSAHAIVVVDFPDRVRIVRDFIKSIDSGEDASMAAAGNRVGRPLEVGYFHTQYITAKSAEQALTAVLSKSGRVGVMEREDRLLVSDFAENLSMVQKVLERIDHPRPQVRITALIYDISLQDIEQLGLNWKQTAKGNIDASTGKPKSSLGIDSVTQVPFAAGATGSTLTFMNLSRHLDLTAVALMLDQNKDARLIGNPNVAVLENDEATFQSVQEIPFQQLTQTSAGGQIGTTSFKEAGISLHVRPKIANDGTIEMIVTPEFSRLTGFTPGDNQPIIDKRTATTSLRVCDRQTVVIGGLRQRSDVGDFKGLPYLKDIPGIGRAFRSRDTDVRESELVVFIMPEIIGYADAPGRRDQTVADTSHCRLDQIPWAEGCPPQCRRLPFDPNAPPEAQMLYDPAMMQTAPQAMPPGAPADAPADLPLPTSARMNAAPQPAGPLMQPAPQVIVAQRAAQDQFGSAGNAPHVQAMVADGKLRRLPIVVQPIPANSRTPIANTEPATSSPLFNAPSPSLPSIDARRPTGGLEFPR